MATFEPGHLHIQRAKLQPRDFGYDIKLDYEVVSDPKEGPSMHFTLHGEINGKAFEEEFTLTKDMACNFASVAFHAAMKHGMPKSADLRTMHKEYDLMFEDIREQLNVKPGDPVKPEHLE
ncbi:DUF5064 family protein [Pseudomonas sp. H11T01]|uniref:DUF5064 family protein n=1 Tax=Pseudomonas sp. H11T01 TaxID=3402749 RepID=UPI003AC70693